MNDNLHPEDDPLAGAGEEMLPPQGSPFDDLIASEEAEPAVTDARLTSGDEFATQPYLPSTEVGDILEDARATIESAAEEEQPESDSGHGAVEPIMTEDVTPQTPGMPTTEVAKPPEQSTTGMPISSEAAATPPSPYAGLIGSEAVVLSEGLKAETDMLELLITKKRVNDLWDRIEQARLGVAKNITSASLARSLYEQIERARNELLAGRDHYEEAERSLSEVEFRVATFPQVAKESYSWKGGLGLLFYEILWMIFYIILILFLPSAVAGFLEARLGDTLGSVFGSTEDIHIFIVSLMMGGFGGVVGALYALWLHIARDQDYSNQYVMWYLTNPLMGMLLGGVMFLFIKGGLIAVTPESGADIDSPYIIYILAWIVGYQQNVAYDIIRRVLRVFRIQGAEE